MNLGFRFSLGVFFFFFFCCGFLSVFFFYIFLLSFLTFLFCIPHDDAHPVLPLPYPTYLAHILQPTYFHLSIRLRPCNFINSTAGKNKGKINDVCGVYFVSFTSYLIRKMWLLCWAWALRERYNDFFSFLLTFSSNCANILSKTKTYLHSLVANPDPH